MDLSKMSNERKLHLCKWYFRGGFALLPFLWAVNAVWFAQEAFTVPQYDEQKQIRRYVIFSGLGAFVWFAGLLAWIITFQTHRATWGEFGDSISWIIPTGIP
ncbi:gamma-secretase subunit pen-2 [Neodiprion pinetum]|uniref:Gamma-secretase subunit PEN-2 n=1 Tax=Neodiprion lecontei TaxID=441921 RepID=A0A6J0BTF5_NEOLC|nr:gamma-secretase subunit pen-2 [Neodiprion lecontei]XP_046421605.1 gamma-secretase subunit pen-2 [Neodiprion fabricii]XP_046478045.1 gamma-secretase subunit pen-2 [Neodiprion pinetum]XP_046615545.1 gamma-secretase subunit pen-2 [Neodiprion virginianus]